MLVGSLLLGAGVGQFLGMMRGRPGRAALAGSTGGAIGAWVGVAFYWFAILPEIHDPLIFTASVLAGFLLGAMPLACVLAGPPDPTRNPPFKALSAPLGLVFGGLLGAVLGLAAAYLSVVPGSAAGLENLGYCTNPLLGFVVGGVGGWVAAIVSKQSNA